MSKHPWYINGLHFECSQCGDCCSGPEEGYIWITKPEIELLAKHLGENVDAVKKKYLKRYGLRFSIKEDRRTKDCIFLINGSCAVYNVRPNQCHTWPFWTSNLASPDSWSAAAVRCPGINRGRLYSFEEIEKRRKQKKWFDDKPDSKDL